MTDQADIHETTDLLSSGVSPNGEERLDEAAAAFAAALGPDEDEAAEATGEPEEAVPADGEPGQADGGGEPAEAEETPAKDKDEETAEAAEPERPDGSGEDAKAWEFAQARKTQRRAERMMEQMDERMRALEARERALDAIPDPRTDWPGHIDAMARRYGLSQAQYVEKLNNAVLRDGEQDPAAQYEHLQAQIAELRAAREREQQQAQQRAYEQQRQGYIGSVVDSVMGIYSQPNLQKQAASKWPTVARGKPEAMRHELQLAAGAIQRAWEQRGEAHLYDDGDLAREALDVVEKRFAGLFGAAEAPPKTTEDLDTSKARDGQGTPEAKASKPAGEKPRSLTNRDAATGSTARRTLEGDDRLDYAAAALMGE